jgi:hypothetical protein
MYTSGNPFAVQRCICLGMNVVSGNYFEQKIFSPIEIPLQTDLPTYFKN